MKNFCPECGAKLEKDYKFCPNCGSKLGDSYLDDSYIEQDSSSADADSNPDKVICWNCGEENDVNNTICSSCGIKLETKGSKSKKQVKKTSAPKKTSRTITASKGEEKKGKTLNTKMFLIIFGAILVIAIVIIISSGVLSTPPVSVTNTSESTVNQPSVI